MGRVFFALHPYMLVQKLEYYNFKLIKYKLGKLFKKYLPFFGYLFASFKTSFYLCRIILKQ